MELAQAYRFSRQDYYQMLESGILTEDSRVELIEGEILALAAQNRPHAYCTTKLTRILLTRFGDGYHVRVQLPIILDNYTEPEPDFAVVTEQQLVESTEHPTQAVLLVEVADSSLAFDRIKKGGLYGRAGFPEYWVVNLRERCLIVHTQPGPNGYQHIQTYEENDLASPLKLTSVLLPAEA
ncbi:Uma2 family endonuclease [bacterium]|nr:Uma2 family endonuclease [bacterium]